jgi:hypothetical protein
VFIALVGRAEFNANVSRVVTVLENMAGQGNVIGSQFEDLRDVIALVKDKTRVGVCLDTCTYHYASVSGELKRHAPLQATCLQPAMTFALKQLTSKCRKCITDYHTHTTTVRL